MSNKLNLYLASPLFNKMELDYNKSLKESLSPVFNVFLPQEDGLLLRDLIDSGVSQDVAARIIFEADLEAMNNSDIILAVLHGAHIDEGVAFELGYCFSRGKKCIALQEDVRQALPFGNNPMISQSCEIIFKEKKSLFEWLVKNFSSTDFLSSLKLMPKNSCGLVS